MSKTYGVTLREREALALIKELIQKSGNQISLKDIAHAMGFDRERARGLLRQLERKKLIKKKMDPKLPYHSRQIIEVVQL